MESERLSKELKILDAAAELIAENQNAVHTLRVADIAHLAGVGKGTVYEYFSSKEEIIQKAVCRRIRLQIEEEWTAAFSRESFRDTFYYAMERMLAEVDSPSVWNLQLLNLLDEKNTEAALEEMRSFYTEKMMPMFQLILDRGTEEGLFPPTAIKEAWQAVVQLFCGLRFVACIGGKEEDYRKSMDRGYEMLLKILRS
ncbi:MAG: TetR/AcrR family transcriptional regulator [Clostridia bacterium]